MTRRELRQYQEVLERWRRREAKYKDHERHSGLSIMAGMMADALEQAINEAAEEIDQ